MKPAGVLSLDDEDEAAAEEENKIINEEYKIWKKNAPYLYDVVITHALQWPTLTCQWFPDRENPPHKPYTTHRLLFGTHTSGQAQDYLQIATVHLPKRDEVALDRSDYDEERGELGSHTLTGPRIQITQRINHEGEVNRARYMPQNPDLIATKTVSGQVFVFDRTKHSSEPERGGICKPDLKLIGQTKEGFGLAWNPSKAGIILGASEDMTVCQWQALIVNLANGDINAYTKAKSTLEPVSVYRGHTSVVGDVSWHATKENMFASVGDDRMLCIWDTRDAKTPNYRVEAHEREILSVAFSPASEYLLITGSADKTIGLWDLRKLAPAQKLHSFDSHEDEVLHLAWSPHSPTVFASASSDRRINIWDLSLIGVEQTPEEQEDEQPPELVFMHGGHTARPTDFCWAPGEQETWTCASASEDNVVMVWAPSMHVWAGEEVKVEEAELEGQAMEGVEEEKGTSGTNHEAANAGKEKEANGGIDLEG
ncbi:WD40 repeat-like protein [Hysterangium stoloniferum]|nr:WD40 repeat-like protein [Hysterangium stoloniferum]